MRISFPVKREEERQGPSKADKEERNTFKKSKLAWTWGGEMFQVIWPWKRLKMNIFSYFPTSRKYLPVSHTSFVDLEHFQVDVWRANTKPSDWIRVTSNVYYFLTPSTWAYQQNGEVWCCSPWLDGRRLFSRTWISRRRFLPHWMRCALLQEGRGTSVVESYCFFYPFSIIILLRGASKTLPQTLIMGRF